MKTATARIRTAWFEQKKQNASLTKFRVWLYNGILMNSAFVRHFPFEIPCPT